VAIGPEGGLTASEVEQGIDAGGTLVAVGQTVLRIETAAIAFAALAAAQLDRA
jgi:RsmE family RNA methyltransferase